ncbi:HNH endonuclease signature motif containing protein [Nonomuraea sp. NPDC050383]|uniref:HNH endonuclease signature motif containing protein n=1 Tax=Nonomuraea sp. NPDC050383 TaxID=3364362 RepID=UPI003797C7CA
MAARKVVRGTVEERWLAKVVPTPDGHWLWPEAPKGCPYPKLGVTLDGRQTTEYAHHVAYRWAYGALPEGRVVHHTCGLRLCSNPEHLQAVDAVANHLEMKERISLQREIAALKVAIASLEAALNEASSRKGAVGDASMA